MLCGSSFKYVGVQRLLDAVAAYLPSPLDRPPVVGHHPKKGTEVTRKPEPRRAVLRPGLQDHQRRPRRPVVRADLLGQAQGRQPGLQPGQGQEGESARGSTTSGPTTASKIERGASPATSSASSASRTRSPATRSATPRTRSCSSGSSSPRPSSACRSSRSARPTRGSWPTPWPRSPARTRPSPTRSTRRPARRSISGMGELHLEILKNRMIRDYKLKVHVGRPRVSYRETIKKAVKRVAGDLHPPDRRLGAVRQGHDRPRARDPAQGGAGAALRQQAQGGRDPLRVHPGDRGRPARGGQVGRPDRAIPLVDLKVTLADGDYHDVDSNDLAFRFAASDALRKAVAGGRRGPAGADHEARGRHARGLPGQRHRPTSPAAGP